MLAPTTTLLEKAKDLAVLEIRAIGPITKPTVEAWLLEQGGEEVAALTSEAIQGLLEDGSIEVWDPEEQEKAYGFCGDQAR